MEIEKQTERFPVKSGIWLQRHCLVDAVNFIANAGTDDRAVRRALDARPEFRRVIGELERDFPKLAAALGVAGVAKLEDDDT